MFTLNWDDQGEIRLGLMGPHTEYKRQGVIVKAFDLTLPMARQLHDELGRAITEAERLQGVST